MVRSSARSQIHSSEIIKRFSLRGCFQTNRSGAKLQIPSSTLPRSSPSTISYHEAGSTGSPFEVEGFFFAIFPGLAALGLGAFHSVSARAGIRSLAAQTGELDSFLVIRRLVDIQIEARVFNLAKGQVIGER